MGGVLADPDQLGAMQDAFTAGELELNWEFPLTLRGVNADQAQGVVSALNRAVTGTPALTGALAPSADSLSVSSPLISDLTLFLTTQAAIQTVLQLLFVSLIVVGAAVIVLAARMIVARRGGELIELTATEFELLRFLMRNPRRVLSKAQILDRVWNYDFGGQAHVVELYISYLRKKIDTDREPLIYTVRGVGYVLKPAS